MQAIDGRYRAWFVLAGLFLVYAASNGILIHTLPLTYPALIDEFGWDQAQVTLPASILFVVAALTSPPVGALLDKYSPRIIMLAGSVTMIVALAAFAFVTALWQLVVIYVLFALSLSTCGLVATMLVLTRWFHTKRGRATGILLMASSLGASVFPLILGAGMASAGWRTALLQFAVIAAVMTLAPVLLLVRDRPLTGTTSAARSAAAPSPADLASPAGPTLREALRQPRFYVIALATGAVWFTIISLIQHQSIYLATDIGIPRNLLPPVFSTFFAFSVVGKLAFGWLSDHFDKGTTLCASITVLVASLVLLRFVEADARTSLFVYAAMAGIGFSGAFTAIQLFIASFFAGHAYGKILAVITLFDTLSGALGTRVIGQMRTSFGSYLPAIDLMIALCVAAIVCVVAVGRLRRFDAVG